MRRIALLGGVGALIVGCTGSHASPNARPTRTVSATSALATGRVSVSIVAYCGAGSRACPVTLLRRMHQDYGQRNGYLIATPTTVLVGGSGCGRSFPAPE